MILIVEFRYALCYRYSREARDGRRPAGRCVGVRQHGLTSAVCRGRDSPLRQGVSGGRRVWASYGKSSGRDRLRRV